MATRQRGTQWNQDLCDTLAALKAGVTTKLWEIKDIVQLLE